MKKSIIFIFLFFLYIQCKEIQIQNTIYNHTNEDNNLYFIATFFSDGARRTYNKENIFGNDIPFSQAPTKNESIQHLEIGRNYKKRYANFLNMNYDKDEIYIISSNFERTIVSIEKELEGLFNKPIERDNIHIIKNEEKYWNIYNLNPEKSKEMNKYKKLSKNRILNIDYRQYFNSEIFPILNNCFGVQKAPNLHKFCESVFNNYFEYDHNNNINNKIGKCDTEKATKIYNFCYDWFNTFREWDEYTGYMFYKLFQHIFDNMNKAINGSNILKMIMIGGHDLTVDKFMDFLDELKIIPRTHYPHYCNIIIELRKYNTDFYLEFYYNDILKYNNTFKNFNNLINNSKYSNINNYNRISSLRNLNETETIENKDEITQNENQNQTEINKDIKDYKNQTNNNNNITNNKTNNLKIYNENIYLNNNKTNTTFYNVKMKLRKFFRQDDDLNLYLILGSIIITTLIIIITIILVIVILKRKKKHFMKLVEELRKNKNNNNLSVVSDSDTKQ